MITLETAQALKEAGFQWKPEIYDFFHSDAGIDNVSCLSLNNGKINRVNHWNWFPGKYHLAGLLFLPRLDQLLTEIERRGYDWSISSNMDICSRDKTEYYAELYGLDGDIVWEINKLDTPTEAAAQALLWILKEG